MPSILNKPTTIDEYKTWMAKNSITSFDARVETHYQSVVNAIHPAVVGSEFWLELSESLVGFDQEYTLKTKYPLMLGNSPPELYKKPYASFLDKSYRKNVLQNRNWPKPPRKGWMIPEDWFDRVGDLVRTTLVVKYLDGVDFLVDKLAAIANKHGLPHRSYFESRDEGYYAAHFYVDFQLGIPNMKWESTERNISVEIQVTTQLQEVIRKLLHSYYEDRRSVPQNRSARKWQWNYRSEEFGANYLGHILHYLEGMIVEIREKRNDN